VGPTYFNFFGENARMTWSIEATKVPERNEVFGWTVKDSLATKAKVRHHHPTLSQRRRRNLTITA